MSLRLRCVLLFALLLGLVPALSGSSQECKTPISSEEAEQAEGARYAALMANDVAALERLNGDDLVYAHSNAALDTKASYMEALRSGKTKYRVLRRGETKARTFGCVAVLTGLTNFEITSGGQDRNLNLRFTSVWVKRPAGLQFVSWQSTLVPAAP